MVEKGSFRQRIISSPAQGVIKCLARDDNYMQKEKWRKSQHTIMSKRRFFLLLLNNAHKRAKWSNVNVAC